MPFPACPSLAKEIEAGVLKFTGAGRYDQAMKRYFESVQNIIKLSLRWPKLEEWQSQVQSVLTAASQIAALQGSASAMAESIASLEAEADAHTVSIANILSSLLSLTSAVNDASVGQYEFTQIAPASTWTIVHNRTVRPGVANVMESPNFVRLHMVEQDDTTIGTTILSFDYNASGIAILTFS